MQSELIFKSIIYNRDYASQVLPHLKPEFFDDVVERRIFGIIEDHANNYKEIPTVDVIKHTLHKARGLSQTDFDRAWQFLGDLSQPFKSPELQFLLDETEEFCQHQSVVKAIEKCIQIIDDSSNIPRTAIPEILKDALSISFNNEVGHDYINQTEERYAKLHEQTARLKTNIKWIDDVFGGGIPRKTLNFFMAQAGGGKSLFLAHLLANYFIDGYNCLYISLELSEERIGERIDANLMDIDVIDIPKMSMDDYKNKVAKIGDKTKGRLFIKEFPPASITAQHIRALLDELKLKQGFVPDVVVVDYLNLVTSSRFKTSSGANSYTILKSVAEELRALAIERDFVCLTATQMNRGAVADSDPDMTGISDSMGISHTADSLIAIIRSEELDALGQVALKCLKTRFSDKTNHKSLVGVVWNRMRLKDLGETKQYIAQAISPVDVPTPAFMKKAHGNKFGNINV